MGRRKGERVFDYEFLKKFCEENKLTLLKDYSNIKINCTTIIEAKCIDCDKPMISKQFIKLVKNCNFGCLDHAEKIRRKKTEETSIKVYGTRVSSQNEEVKNRMIATNRRRYGVSYASQSKQAKEKTIEINMRNWGVPHAAQSAIVKKKIRDTNLKRRNVTCSLLCYKIREKIINTHLKLRKVTNPLKCSKIRKKLIETVYKRYGVYHIMQDPVIAEKAQKNAYKSKPFTFPSGTTIMVQGYEPFGLKDLIGNHNIKEEEIFTKRTEVPKVWYTIEDKKHRYYTDIYIPSQNLCIEIKSIHTYEKDKEINLEKQRATQKLGYKHEIWIYDRKGELLQKI